MMKALQKPATKKANENEEDQGNGKTPM